MSLNQPPCSLSGYQISVLVATISSITAHTFGPKTAVHLFCVYEFGLFGLGRVGVLEFWVQGGGEQNEVADWRMVKQGLFVA